MANEEHLKILKQGVEVWNQWREEHPKERPDLQKTDLHGVDLHGATLNRADLNRTDLSETDLSEADLRMANLYKADLYRATLIEANLRWALLRWAVLSGADLHGADFSGATLVQTNLSKANITGARLYGSSREDWIIDEITCDYVFWDPEGKNRTPKDRDFRPGEFEELYRSLPTFEYIFEHGFTPIDAVVIDQAVQAINQRHPNFDLKLATLDSRGQPHAVFTVIHKDYTEEALKEITSDYEAKIKVLEGKREQLMEVISLLTSKPQIGELILGDKRMIQAGRDYLEQVAGDVTTGESEHNDTKTGGRETPDINVRA